MNRVTIQPKMFQWALKRADLEIEDLQKTFPRLRDWEEQRALPTLRQLEALARKTWTPIGYFFLPEPPDEKLPIPDFRTVEGESVSHPSPNLLETVYAMQRRQSWLRDYLTEEGMDKLPFVSSCTTRMSPEHVAQDMRKVIGISQDWARSVTTWTQALLDLRLKVETAGIVTVWSSVVGYNNTRKLDVDEFRGFVLVDEYAPFIFVNSADAKSAQMFTLAHELAHIWLGEAGVVNLRAMQPANNATELFCNRVAAEFLLPKAEFVEAWRQSIRDPVEYEALARRFKVSPLVVARRALDLEYIDKDSFFQFYNGYMKDERRKQAARPPGGDFYRTCELRLGRPFAEAIVRATREGRLLYREAYRLTGLQGATFERYAKHLGAEVL